MANNVPPSLSTAVTAYIKPSPSSSTTHQWNTTQLTVVCVIDTQLGDHLKDRECALEEIQQAVLSVGANFRRVQVSNVHSTKVSLKVELGFTKLKTELSITICPIISIMQQ